MANEKRGPITMWMIALAVGLAGVCRVTQSPGYELYRTVDIVQLLVSGMCFGATMAGVIITLRRQKL